MLAVHQSAQLHWGYSAVSPWLLDGVAFCHPPAGVANSLSREESP